MKERSQPAWICDPLTGRETVYPLDGQIQWKRIVVKPWRKDVTRCGFCPGNEAMTPTAVHVHSGGGKAWQVRVIPNKFPAVEAGGRYEALGEFPFESHSAYGYHEVIIENPRHELETADLSVKNLSDLIRVWRERYRFLSGDKAIRYILVFKNYGAQAGASVVHPHHQLIALPFVPHRAMEEFEGSRRYFRKHKHCYYCGYLKSEKRALRIEENGSFLAAVHEAGSHPFESFIMPKAHAKHLTDLDPQKIRDLAAILKSTLLRYRRKLKNPPFNLMIHSADLANEAPKSFHWHIEILPRIAQAAGFEWGTHVSLNPAPPLAAAQHLKQK